MTTVFKKKQINPVKKIAKKVEPDNSPDNAMDLQDWLYDLWCDIMDKDSNNQTKIKLYNKGVLKYHKITGLYVMAEITDVANQKRAFKDYKKSILNPESERVLTKSVFANTTTAGMIPGKKIKSESSVTTKQRTPRAGGKSQKQICIEEHAAGLTPEQCAEKHGLSLTNVKWYYRYVCELKTRK